MAEYGTLQVGMRGAAEWPVTLATSTQRWAPEQFPESIASFATPDLVHLVEKAASNAVDPHLTEGWLTVGTVVHVRHLAATPPGFTVTAAATLTEIDRRRLVFAVEVHDGVDLVGQGTHERFVVRLEQVAQRLREKAARRPA